MNQIGLPPRSRRGRRMSPAVLASLVLGSIGSIALLWYWVFLPIFIPPEEFFGRQKRFDRAIREVIAAKSDDPTDRLPAWPPQLSVDRLAVTTCAERAVIGGVQYAPQSRKIAFPFGDIPSHLGTSADIVVRCLRTISVDLQQMLAHDRATDPKRYPLGLYRSKKIDRSMDHRRVAFLFTFARAFLPPGPVETDSVEAAAAFIPGDLVFWAADGREGLPGLVGLVSDRRDETGMPLVITLAPDDGRATEHHRLDEWPILGHFELNIEALMERFLETYPGTTLEPAPVTPR